jgi:hypothetical protein
MVIKQRYRAFLGLGGFLTERRIFSFEKRLNWKRGWLKVRALVGRKVFETLC